MQQKTPHIGNHHLIYERWCLYRWLRTIALSLSISFSCAWKLIVVKLVASIRREKTHPTENNKSRLKDISQSKRIVCSAWSGAHVESFSIKSWQWKREKTQIIVFVASAVNYCRWRCNCFNFQLGLKFSTQLSRSPTTATATENE